MPTSFATARSDDEGLAGLGRRELLPRHPVFSVDNLDRVCEHLTKALAPNRLTYSGRDHRLDFRHRRALIGAVEFDALQMGGHVTVDAPDVPDFYLVQFMLEGGCRLTQAGRSYEMTAGSIAVVNACRPFQKCWSPKGRQLMLRIERNLLDRELIAWTGREPRERIEFDQSRAFSFAEAATLTDLVRMLCDAIRRDSATLDHPLLRDRFISALASALLIGLPHNHNMANKTADKAIAPASVRRAERFLEEHVADAVELTDLARAAGVSARALQMAFRRYRDTTPMAHLRALRLEQARRALAETGRDGGLVTTVALSLGFGSLSRFAAHYKSRFGETPSETLRRGVRR